MNVEEQGTRLDQVKTWNMEIALWNSVPMLGVPLWSVVGLVLGNTVEDAVRRAKDRCTMFVTPSDEPAVAYVYREYVGGSRIDHRRDAHVKGPNAAVVRYDVPFDGISITVTIEERDIDGAAAWRDRRRQEYLRSAVSFFNDEPAPNDPPIGEHYDLPY